MVTIPGGSFEMGSLARQSTQPVHKVELNTFSLGKYEVTVKEFGQFIKATNYPAPTECRHELDGWFKLYSKGNWEVNKLNSSQFQPVVCINWKAAQAYTQWLAKETGKPYRLVSEAEWEYAARAGTDTDYFFGDDEEMSEVCQYANTADLYGESILQMEANTTYFNWSSGLANCVDHSAYASIVGMYKANPYGLHDIVSNVLEFTADCYVGGYEGAPTDGSARIEEKCERRSTRGGSWHWTHWPHAFRSNISEDFAGGVDGFRVALDGAAPELSTATRRFLKELGEAQVIERKRRQAIPKLPDPVTGFKLENVKEGIKLSWDADEKGVVDSYRIYRNQVPGKMFELIATNIKSNSFIDANFGEHRYEYTVVAVKNHLQSAYADPVTKPSGWLSIESKIEAEWATSIEGASVSFSSDNERKGSVLTGSEGISDSAIITYHVDVDSAGSYLLEYRVASIQDTEGFEVYINNKKHGANPVLKTDGYHKWQTQTGVRLKLKEGKNRITFKSLDSHWKLNWFSLKKI
nr:SUMF1/EgtB/PvdO family nonheme iron enzyme [Aliikangiella sp. G2MR2-5]